MNARHPVWLIGAALSTVACSSTPHSEQAVPMTWQATGERAAFPAIAVSQATAITIDATYIYWITSDAFLYRAPRSGGEVDRVSLPAPGLLLGAHNDVFVGWTDGSGNAAIADIDPATGSVLAINQQAGALLGLVAGQRGYSFASASAGGTRVQTCHDGACVKPPDIPSDFKSLALDLPTKTFYVLTADGLRTCTLSDGCPATAAAVPSTMRLMAALPGTYFMLDASGQAFAMGGSTALGSADVPNAKKLMVVDGNGQTASPVGTWSNGSALAQALLAPGTTTSELANACTDFDVDATGRPLYCLVGNTSIQLIP